jgi:dihydroflavonol-4-reductase
VRALVTGATGFVGSAIARGLTGAGWQVRVLARSGYDRRNIAQLPVEIATGDLLDATSLDQALCDCDALFHAAADYRLGVANAERLYRTNVEGTRNVLNAARRAATARIAIYEHVATFGLPADRSPVRKHTHRSRLPRMIGH